MDYRSRGPADPEAELQAAMDGRQAQIWTSMPGIVTKVDLVKMTVEVQPAIQGKQAMQDSTVKLVNLPVIPDVPIIFPSAGGYTLTFPIAVGDECTLQFHARCIDDWWQSGQVGIPLSSRMHDLSDATAHFGPKSQPKVIGNISSTNAQFRSNDGTQFVEIDTTNRTVRVLSNGKVVVTATDEVDVTAPTVVVTAANTVNINAQTSVNITAQQVHLNATTVTVAGTLLVGGEITRGFGGPSAVTVGAHRHTEGANTTSPPIPGT